MRRLPSGAPILTAAAMRAGEWASGVAEPELMQRAGAAVAQEVARLATGRPVLVLAGPGKNGGDARIAADWLSTRGHDVTVASLAEIGGAKPQPVLLDGLFGTGISRPLDCAGDLQRLATAAELVIALDLPSGLETDAGRSLGAVRADVTVALGALKPAHVLGEGVALCGHVLLRDIGVPAAHDWRTIARPALAAPSAADHKFARGLVTVIGGVMPGAALLAARAALHGGAGYAVLAGVEGGPDALVHRDVETALADERTRALLIGPGLGRDAAARALLARALVSAHPLVLDGDALSLIGHNLQPRAAPTILTPHGGEFARMFSTSGSKIAQSIAAARSSDCTVVHKGADTVIAHPDGRVTVSAGAPAWLASAGTGDVLAGLVAARLAACGTPEEAVWLHTRAAALAGPALIADMLVDAMPAAVEECL
jgi:hydroxyethylthiazole kinase-like uncharacterized protein yjeF